MKNKQYKVETPSLGTYTIECTTYHWAIYNQNGENIGNTQFFDEALRLLADRLGY